MKIRTRKSKRNTEYELEDFLLKEFSKDKEIFVPDPELSCNECIEVEDLENKIDSPLSFMVKLKADILSDPRAIKPGVSGYTLPEEYSYELEKVESLFESIANNHYILKLKEEDLKKLGKIIHSKINDGPIYSNDEVNDYLFESHEQNEWESLLKLENKKKWRKYIGKKFKDKLKNDFGKIDRKGVEEAIEIDKAGFIAIVQKMNKLECFNEEELKHLAPYL